MGGPITDFGDEGEAGPSRRPRSVEHCSCDSDAPSATMPALLTRKRQRQSNRVAAAAAFTLLSLSTVAAGPVPAPTDPPSPTRVLNIEPRSIHTEPLYTVITIPTVPVTPVPETVLPIYLTKSSDGGWYKVDNPWSLYGRVAVSFCPKSLL